MGLNLNNPDEFKGALSTAFELGFLHASKENGDNPWTADQIRKYLMVSFYRIGHNRALKDAYRAGRFAFRAYTLTD